MGKSILIVDDEEPMRTTLKKTLLQEGYTVATASTCREALGYIRDNEPDMVLLDFRMPDMDGLEALNQIKRINNELPVIIMTAHGGVEIAISAIQQGASDYLAKPFSVEELCINIQMALERNNLNRKVKHFKEIQRRQYKNEMIVAETEQMRKIYQMVKKITNSQIKTVLICGESGTGKQLVAQAIHYESPRADWPFLQINCGAIPETLLESELFGYEKGAFTNAYKRKIGLLEEADNGTFFFDEIGDMPPQLQGKLLKFLDSRSFRRVGGIREISVDIRIITATNQELEKLVEEKKIRADLFYRLNVAPINLPPLRQRREDISPLAQNFLRKSSLNLGKNIESISPEAEQILLQYHWPGNIRELKNVIERAVILSTKNEILPSVLPIRLMDATGDLSTKTISEATADKSLIEMVHQLERQAIQLALDRTKGNQVQTAKILGISRDILRYRMKRYQLS